MAHDPRRRIVPQHPADAARGVLGAVADDDNPAMLGVFDLSCDPTDVIGLGIDELIGNMSGPDRAIRTINSNRMPAITELDLVPDAAATLRLPSETIRQRAEQVMGTGEFHQRVALALAQRFPPREPSRIVEERMYEGFPSRADKHRMAAFHIANGAERAEMVETFEDDRLRELGRRLVFYENPDSLDPHRRDMLATWLRNRRYGRADVTAGRTLGTAMEEIEQATADMPDLAAEAEAIRR
jgi:exodeoxyribonuclease-1